MCDVCLSGMCQMSIFLFLRNEEASIATCVAAAVTLDVDVLCQLFLELHPIQ